MPFVGGKNNLMAVVDSKYNGMFEWDDSFKSALNSIRSLAVINCEHVPNHILLLVYFSEVNVWCSNLVTVVLSQIALCHFALTGSAAKSLQTQQTRRQKSGAHCKNLSPGQYYPFLQFQTLQSLWHSYVTNMAEGVMCTCPTLNFSTFFKCVSTLHFPMLLSVNALCTLMPSK